MIVTAVQFSEPAPLRVPLGEGPSSEGKAQS